jgi:ABC-type transporter Mla maintaining outer membrane lipid asymmetry permease subunit MlaE
VAERIRTTGESHGKTTIVVTHDYLNLAPVADEVLLLDHQRKTLRKIEPGELQSLGETSTAVPTALPGQESRPGATRRLWRQATGVLETTGGALLGALLVFVFLVPVWRSLRWALRYLWHYFWLLASPSSCLYFAASGLITGFVSTHFTFKFLPHRQYTEPLLSDELLNGLGFATYRILVPILLTILVAARCGAAVASDVGGRVYAHQVDAMRSMGVSSERYLLTNILYAFLLATPLLIGLGFLAAKIMSMTVFVYNHPELGAHYWDGHYHRDLRIPGHLFYLGSEWLIVKLLVCGAGVGAIAYFIGRRPKGSGVEVSRGITATIIGATLYVLVVHFVFAFVEF